MNQPAGGQGGGEAAALARIDAVRARRPRLNDAVVTLAHGAGGKASAALVDAVFIEAFGQPCPDELTDAALLDVGSGGQIALTTDSYVVNPRRFPGGSIGHLAVNGTVNDLAVSGARPAWLSAAFVIEEGMEVAELKQIAADMRQAASQAGVAIVTGDTKVVPKGAADGCFITTAGVGIVPPGRRLGAKQVICGDAMVVSGPLGSHGMAVMMARGNLALEADIRSDCAPVNHQVEALLAAVPDVRWMRDATRGGLATVANELARASGLGVMLDDAALPVIPAVRGACDMLGIDPLYVANEGVFVAVVPAQDAQTAVEAIASVPAPPNHPADAALSPAVIGHLTSQAPGLVGVQNAFGGTRLVDMLVGDPLPRIC
ncbi:MAG: hydrogenase expression/formation protein HypE [Bifidobacteriaceae bacterium]|jgi:hydrogenase expression/formation protein HypE|nr:hydrogenase expression/formation protein HypE [Bifidobacteriaceae bacterium]